MRVFIKNVINKKDADTLKPGKQDFNNPIIKNILVKLEEFINKRTYNSPSYCVVEESEKGHDWHIDTGSMNHMQWCNYGVSILLRKSDNGIFKYKEPNKEYTQNEHYLNALVHSSDQWHKREDATKGRKILLMFLA